MAIKSGFNLRVIPNVCNDVSDEMKALVRPLKRGEIKTYRLPVPVQQDTVEVLGVKIYKNKKTKGYTWPQSQQIPTIDEIMDLDGIPKKIAVVRNYDQKTGEITPFPLFIDEQMDGYFIVHGGQSSSEMFYPYLELTDFNGSKKDRDTSKPIYFYEIDVNADVAKKGREIDILTEELVYVRDMPNEELILFSKSLLWETNGVDIKHLKGKLKAYVLASPGQFTDLYKNKEKIKNRAIMQDAIKEGIVTFSELENKFTFTHTGKDIATFTRIDGKETLDQMAEWMSTHKDGEKVALAIKNVRKQPMLQED